MKKEVLYLIIALVLLISACNPTRRLSEEKVFLQKQSIEVIEADKGFDIEKDEMQEVLRQRTNRKIFGTLRFNLWAYNLVSDGRIEKAASHKAKRRASRNEKRMRKGKEALKEKNQTKWSWLKYTVGEPPVVLDSALAEKSSQQLEVFLQKKGYFDAGVSFEVDTTRNGKRAKVSYILEPREPYLMRAINWEIRDTEIARRLEYFRSTSLLESGERFDVDELDKERERVTTYLNNRGYYGFTKEFILYEADSTGLDHQVDLNLQVRKVKQAGAPGQETVNHKKYFIGQIYVHTNYDPLQIDYYPTDTLYYKDIAVLYSGELNYKPDMLNYALYIRRGELYQKDNIDLTYRRFGELGVFRSVSILLEESITGGNNYLLDCHIYLTPAKKQGVSAETRGTHRGGSLGISANTAYRHKNVFGGAESVEFKIQAGLEAQPLVTQELNVQGEGTQELSQALVLNTFEIGPELSLVFHRLYPISVERLARSNDPTTTFSANFNFQVRPDYTRTLSTFRMRYRFQETSSKTHIIDPVELSIIKIDKSQQFTDRIEELNDQFLLASYSNHLIAASGYTFVYNNQALKTQRSHIFNSISTQAAGNVLRLLYNNSEEVKDENDSYRLFDIRFAQYVRVENDFRYYRNFTQENSIVFRLDLGGGLPLNNLDVLPFDRSFFVGGSNGIRAWQARTLGPGSYRDSTAAVTFNNIGEVKIEANVEYRFDLTSSLKGAFFVDAGNIWLLKEDNIRPGSGFRSDRFYSEIAVGAGLGLRFDFDFFLIRIDGGVQLKDPAKVPGERWFWEPKEEYNAFLNDLNPEEGLRYRPRVTFNLGIGYPF